MPKPPSPRPRSRSTSPAATNASSTTRSSHMPRSPNGTATNLTLYDKTQWVDNVRTEIVPRVRHSGGQPSASFPPSSAARLVRLCAPGPMSRSPPWRPASSAGPVRVELTRRQCFTSVGARPKTEQRVRIGAERDGKLIALIQEAWGQTSTYEEYAEVTLDPPRAIYSCPNVLTRYRLVEMNINTPCPMRAPGTATGVMALEMAMDEMAEQLGLDPDRVPPAQLCRTVTRTRTCRGRARNCAPATPRRRTLRLVASRRRCRDATASGNWLIGHGMATAFYPSHRAPAAAQAILLCQRHRRRPHRRQRHGPRNLHRHDPARRRCARSADRARAVRTRRYRHAESARFTADRSPWPASATPSSPPAAGAAPEAR